MRTTIVLIIAGLIMIWGIKRISESRYSFYHYKSPDNTKMVTRLEYKPFLGQHSTFFVYGQYQKTELPATYIKPKYSGRDGGFVIMTHWDGDQCTIFAPFGSFDTLGLKSNFKFKIAGPYTEEWKQMERDTLDGNNKILNDFTF